MSKYYDNAQHIDNSKTIHIDGASIDNLGDFLRDFLSDEHQTPPVSKPKQIKSPRPTPHVNKSYMTFAPNGITMGHIALLCQHLMKIEWIPKDTPPDDFQKLFSGKVCVCKIKWIGGGIDNLYELFKQIKDQELITIPGDYGLDAVLSNHFVDKNGNPLLVKYNGRPAKKGLPKISECIKILQTQYEGFN